MMRFLLCCIFLCFSIFALYAADLFMSLPKGWDCIDDSEQLPQKVHMIYIGPGKNQFSPSINLAIEKTSLTLEEYLTLAKSYHEEQADTYCKQFGTIQTTAGNAYLLQIDRVTQWGDVRFLQAVLMHEQTVYVITATCLQQEFAALSPRFFKSIKSFSIHKP